MEGNNTKTQADGTTLFAGEAWFDAIEAGFWGRVREFIEVGGCEFQAPQKCLRLINV